MEGKSYNIDISSIYDFSLYLISEYSFKGLGCLVSFVWQVVKLGRMVNLDPNNTKNTTIWEKKQKNPFLELSKVFFTYKNIFNIYLQSWHFLGLFSFGSSTSTFLKKYVQYFV